MSDLIVPESEYSYVSPEAAKLLRKKAEILAKRMEEDYMELARILYTVSNTKSDVYPHEPLFREWGFPTFDNYAEEELGLRDRKAKYLRRIWWHLEIQLQKMDPDVKKRIIALGWTKVRELVRVLTLSNAKEWADRAEKESYSTLLVSIAKYRLALEEAQNNPANANKDVASLGVSLPPQQNYVRKVFSLDESKAPVVAAALAKAAVLTDYTEESYLITMICTDFLATNAPGSDIDAKIRYVARLEECLGLKLVAVDKHTNSILYGIETLQKVADSNKEEDI